MPCSLKNQRLKFSIPSHIASYILTLYGKATTATLTLNQTDKRRHCLAMTYYSVLSTSVDCYSSWNVISFCPHAFMVMMISDF